MIGTTNSASQGGIQLPILTTPANAGQILSGYQAIDGSGNIITGSIASRGAQTITPGRTSQTIAAGQYLSGTQTISGDSDLIASNIKNGVNIFGVTGTYEGTTVLYGSVTRVSNTQIRLPSACAEKDCILIWHMYIYPSPPEKSSSGGVGDTGIDTEGVTHHIFINQVQGWAKQSVYKSRYNTVAAETSGTIGEDIIITTSGNYCNISSSDFSFPSLYDFSNYYHYVAYNI